MTGRSRKTVSFHLAVALNVSGSYEGNCICLLDYSAGKWVLWGCILSCCHKVLGYRQQLVHQQISVSWKMG